ncbi:DMT family transporter [Sporolactobacillus shoreae]|uniref:DMT family transporter n=1 Tax=Sporolactobacillus shoreae TaxID=1465501 RepID=A0A4Z0GP69_9BACL|nr:DMT family transporter [Sporolactobacillus shoreae]TGA98973.1 DMT family transporter [Sporolactobacillus shoreae]
MKKAIFYLVALISGTALSLEGAIYGELGKIIGQFESSFYNFFVGSILLTLIVLFFGRGKLSHTLSMPRWYLLGGLFGVSYLTILVFGVPKVGVGISMIAVVAGQMIMSMFIEHFGWLGSVKNRITRRKVLAIVCMLGALIVIY